MLQRIHRWIGVALTLWLVLATLSGVLLLWQDEYFGWRYPALPSQPQSLSPNAEVIEQIVSDTNGRVESIRPPTGSLPAYYAYFADGGVALFHPGTAARIAEWGVLDTLPAFLFELHAHLLLGKTGLNVVGIFACLLCVNLTLGLVLWNRRRNVYRVRYFLPKKPSRPLLLRAHAAQGFSLSVLLLFLALTGVTMAFSAPVYAGLNAIFGSADLLRPTVRKIDAESIDVNWPVVLSSISAEFPTGAPRELTLPKSEGEPLIVRLRNAGELHPNGRSYLVLNAGTGTVHERIDATKTGVGPTIGNAMYPIHSGKTGWPGHRLALSLLSMSLLFIAVSGSYLALSRK
tara:strand:+ start:45601 stop:46635 length:1035 start_codon:yes stop_codon:yes gene_type:complete